MRHEDVKQDMWVEFDANKGTVWSATDEYVSDWRRGKIARFNTPYRVGEAFPITVIDERGTAWYRPLKYLRLISKSMDLSLEELEFVALGLRALIQELQGTAFIQDHEAVIAALLARVEAKRAL